MGQGRSWAGLCTLFTVLVEGEKYNKQPCYKNNLVIFSNQIQNLCK